MARFFIDRPIFAWVISIVIMLAGLLAIRNLPISQYPEIAPPAIRVTTTYRGAAASTIESNVVQVIEEVMTGGRIIRPAYKNILQQKAYKPINER